MAEREGFEPSVPLRVHYLSRVARSTALAPLPIHQRLIRFWVAKIQKITLLARTFQFN